MESLVSPHPAAEPPADPGAFAALVARSDLIAMALTRGDTLLSTNAAFRDLFGVSDDLAGTLLSSLVIAVHRARIAAILRVAGAAQAICVAEALRADGRTVVVEFRACEVVVEGESLCAIFAQEVIDRPRTAARLNLAAFVDPLTGLANRAQFADRLRQAALGSRRYGSGFALLLLELDDFSPVIDRHGQAISDTVLQHVAQRLLARLRAAEAVARLGRDQFAVLLPGIAQRGDAVGVAERVLEAIRQPMGIGEHRLMLSAAAGIALFPAHGNTVDQLLVAAGTALDTAKRVGGGCGVWAAQSMPPDAALPTILWGVAHEVGVPEIDAQHAELAALLNELAADLRDGRNTGPSFQAFIRAAAAHFAAEERLMAQSAYAGTAAHREMHRRLLADVSGLSLQPGEGDASLMLRYLQEWLFRHVDGADREFAVFLLASDLRLP